MKLKLVISLLIGSVAVTEAVIVRTTTNFDKAVVDSSGVLIPANSGIVALGYFTVADAEIPFLNGADLQAAFVVWGASEQVGFNNVGGSYEFNADGGRVGAASPFFGQNYYSVIGDGATFADSTQALVFKHNGTFPNDAADPIPANPAAVLGVEGTYIFGGPTGTDVELAPTFSVPAIGMAVLVPEPSVALLGAIGALGLLRRRRI